jgi:1,4-dihydroxy-6-naphthoate synthase
MKISIAISPCPNDTFIFAALANNWIDTQGLQFEFTYTDIEELNQLAFAKKFDVIKLSFFALGKITQDYQLLSSGAALGYNCGPLLVTSGIKELEPDHRIAIPGENTTANFLLSLAYPELKNKKVVLFSAIEEAVLEGEVDAGLLIHENRFTYEQRGLSKIRDLGEFWNDFAGEAIPLGAIAIKREWSMDLKKKVNHLIRESLKFAYNNTDMILSFVEQHAQEMDHQVMLSHIKLYVNEQSLGLNDEAIQAIQKLFSTGHQLKLLPEIHEPLLIQ